RLSLWFLIPLAFFTWANRLYWTSLIRKFAHGDANPGVVVAVQPTLVAVFTDLTTGRGNFPAVKISQCPLRRISGQKPQIGLRLATTAVYGGDFNKESWTDFYPVAIETGSGNRQANAEVLASFAEEAWQKLATALDEVPSLQPG